MCARTLNSAGRQYGTWCDSCVTMMVSQKALKAFFRSFTSSLLVHGMGLSGWFAHMTSVSLIRDPGLMQLMWKAVGHATHLCRMLLVPLRWV